MPRLNFSVNVKGMGSANMSKEGIMKKIFHKIATCTTVIFISMQPVSVDLLAAEKEPSQTMTPSDDKSESATKIKATAGTSKKTENNAGKIVADTPFAQGGRGALQNNAPRNLFPLSQYMVKKMRTILAWINMDIEADLH